jgi:hypothetical protein
MKKYEALVCVTVFLILIFTIIPRLCAEDKVGNLKETIEIAATALHEWMPNIAYNSVDNEFLVVWYTTITRKEDGQKIFSFHGQRMSPEGKLLGKTISLAAAGPDKKILPILTYNPSANQYMVSFTMEQKTTGQDPFIILLDSRGKVLSGPACLSSTPTNASHAVVVFNAKRKQYLVAYNDSRNGNADIFGVILSEDGSIIKQDFAISSAKGDQINPYVCYNPTDDKYLVNWEDFRHVKHWKEPSNIYGALLDGQGNIIAGDIPMMEDHGLDDEGDQRHNTIAYNPTKNEFLVCWMDARPSLSNLGIVGKIIKSDGSISASSFIIADAQGPQIFPQVMYNEKRAMYLVIWDDGRNDDPDKYWRTVENWDVYGTWLTPLGKRQNSDIPICVKGGTQRYARAVYAPATEKYLIAWRDSYAPHDYEPVGGNNGGHLRESKGDIRGIIYSAP